MRGRALFSSQEWVTQLTCHVSRVYARRDSWPGCVGEA